MTLPKGYVPPNKKADEQKAKQLADEQKAKQLADEQKAKPKINDTGFIQKGDTLDKSEHYSGISDIAIDKLYPVDYALIWDEMKKAYMQTVKEAATSYFRLLDLWIKDFKK